VRPGIVDLPGSEFDVMGRSCLFLFSIGWEGRTVCGVCETEWE
jgi:hypothetical protein